MSLSNAFAALRKNGFYARQNFLCCSGCALSAIADNRKPKHTSFAYFHKQDADDLKRHGYTYIGFGSFADTPENNRLAGEQARTIFESHGCPVEWDGSPSKRMVVWESEDVRRAYALRRLGAVPPKGKTLAEVFG